MEENDLDGGETIKIWFSFFKWIENNYIFVSIKIRGMIS